MQKYAEPETDYLVHFSSTISQKTPYRNTVVIPAFNESAAFIERFIASDLSNKKVLLILVINQPDSETDSQPQIELEQKVKQSGRQLWQQNNLTLISLYTASTDILVVDRFSSSRTIEDKQGVGLARKIGADIATALICKGLIESPWICSTDADTFLPDNYFSVLTDIPQKTSAITYNFNHINNADPLSEATHLYEQALRYYVSGLRWAGSNYAFHTIGSTLAFRYDYYSMVRGFPKRAAGEDFYLLNKLAKQATVKSLDSATLTIESRISDRVPFGTGPAVSKILSLDQLDDYHYYHPQLFVELKNCLQAMNSLWQYKDQTGLWLSRLSDPSQLALKQLKFIRLIKHIQSHATNEQQCNRHINQWFDAFRTLKFMHYLQQDFFPAIPLNQAIVEAVFNIK